MSREALVAQVQAGILEVQGAGGLTVLEALRVRFLGKKGLLALAFKELGELPPAERPEYGHFLQSQRALLEKALEDRKVFLESEKLQEKFRQEACDPTVPAPIPYRGGEHLLTQVTERIVQILKGFGFELALGPEIETDFYNFESMNMPEGHPAREMQDTFFVGPGKLLRTHTSPVQMRSLIARREQPFPLRIIAPGAVYRRDTLDATHTPQFHQIEGLWVDEGVHLGHLKGVLEAFLKALLGESTQIRLRPSYFPFVEPGVEVDVSCFRCAKKSEISCSICKGTSWLEILGAGIVHPHLFRSAGWEAPFPTGFAFGMGVERLALLLCQIPDIRFFYQGELPFLNQYRAGGGG